MRKHIEYLKRMKYSAILNGCQEFAEELQDEIEMFENKLEQIEEDKNGK